MIFTQQHVLRLARSFEQRCGTGPRLHPVIKRNSEPVGFEFVDGPGIGNSNIADAQRQGGGKEGKADKHGSMG
ncbi:hypothetical protein [Duganella sp. Leaf61]|uniref:hypothetical protein n=1 Tax=Duganella sp. Leaf61 TaxID=1736227 RepID=UPI0012E26B85|nr:hypothetical protein [Duganella sp. Leaf61]